MNKLTNLLALISVVLFSGYVSTASASQLTEKEMRTRMTEAVACVEVCGFWTKGKGQDLVEFYIQAVGTKEFSRNTYRIKGIASALVKNDVSKDAMEARIDMYHEEMEAFLEMDVHPEYIQKNKYSITHVPEGAVLDLALYLLCNWQCDYDSEAKQIKREVGGGYHKEAFTHEEKSAALAYAVWLEWEMVNRSSFTVSYDEMLQAVYNTVDYVDFMG